MTLKQQCPYCKVKKRWLRGYKASMLALQTKHGFGSVETAAAFGR